MISEDKMPKNNGAVDRVATLTPTVLAIRQVVAVIFINRPKN